VPNKATAKSWPLLIDSPYMCIHIEMAPDFTERLHQKHKQRRVELRIRLSLKNPVICFVNLLTVLKAGSVF
jgi:hypothetical protein